MTILALGVLTLLKSCTFTQSPFCSPSFCRPLMSLFTQSLTCRADRVRSGFSQSMYSCLCKHVIAHGRKILAHYRLQLVIFIATIKCESQQIHSRYLEPLMMKDGLQYMRTTVSLSLVLSMKTDFLEAAALEALYWKLETPAAQPPYPLISPLTAQI